MSTISTQVTEEEIANGIKDEFGVVYSKDGYRLLECQNKELESFEIKDGTVAIASNAFHSCGIKKITLRDTLIVIGFAAFRFCKNLEEITLPHSLEHLGGYAFYGCHQLHTIHINGTFTWNDAWFNKNPFDDHWGYFNPFGYMESIKHFTNTNPNFVVEGGALYNAEKTVLFRCSTLNRKIHIPNSVEYILDNAFCNCKYLQEIALPAKLWFLGISAFSDCKSLQQISIPEGSEEKFKKMLPEELWGKLCRA